MIGMMEWNIQFGRKVSWSPLRNWRGGRAAVDFVRIHKTKINFKRVRANIGAFWTVFGNINLNSLYYTYDTSFDDLRIKISSFMKRVICSKGIMTALSVYGELDAWQLEFGIYHRVKGVYPHKVIEELMSLPLGYDRPTLSKAVQLMQAYAGKGYRADLLPLFPWKKETKLLADETLIKQSPPYNSG